MFVFDVCEEQETTKVLWGENHSNFEESWALPVHTKITGHTTGKALTINK